MTLQVTWWLLDSDCGGLSAWLVLFGHRPRTGMEVTAWVELMVWVGLFWFTVERSPAKGQLVPALPTSHHAAPGASYGYPETLTSPKGREAGAEASSCSLCAAWDAEGWERTEPLRTETGSGGADVKKDHGFSSFAPKRVYPVIHVMSGLETF